MNAVTNLVDTESNLQAIEKSIASTESVIFETENKIRLASVCENTTPSEVYRKSYANKGIALKGELTKLKTQLSVFKEGYSKLIKKHLKQLN